MTTLKKKLNSLYCPLCSSQVDGIPLSVRFYCVSDGDHYNIWFKNGQLRRETINLYDYNKLIKYEISQTYFDNNTTKTKILLENIDAEGRVIFSFDENSYSADISLFDFRNFNIEKALNKIKTFLVFG